ncbi:flagellar export protein FliJ [Clostridium aciditolerans]|uniref:Flagellar FliJ protein n=1 Tax=Clostridium aciditolerans TaxID=339861 RepID=A0A934HW95_9CLOT|nr:flagellar export protein FliJ [Clostridium aciditolerans]MBI6875781.1 flagellar export protein FliJ [Clostridium aciditolerans]
MQQYHFRLQKLLDIRLQKEDESKRIFKEAQSEKLKVEKKLNELKDNYIKYRTISNKESVIEQKIRHVYLNAINYSINEAHEELAKKQKVLEEKRDELKQKQIERKTVETLKEKQKATFLKEQNFIEQKANDEFALYGFIRNLKNLKGGEMNGD